MEWSALPAGNGISYEPPADPVAYLQALGASISLFLGGKALLPASHVRLETAPFISAVRANPADVRANLALITGLQRLKELGGTADDEALNLARTWLASEPAQALGLGSIEL
jgi:hypothetical protein